MVDGSEKLHVFGPGGPYNAIKECAETFSQLHGVAVVVIKGQPEFWLNPLADLIYGGAPYMLVDFAADHPEAIDLGNVFQLYERQIVILVRNGNPQGITRLADLGLDGIKVLDVKLEKMSQFQNYLPTIKSNIYMSVTTGNQGVEAWRSHEELDAWITYKSWHYVLSQETEFIHLPEEMTSLRTTPIAITSWTKKRKLALDFISFLQSESVHPIFRKWGWE